MKSLFQQRFETIVVGGGFAGAAAAWAAASDGKTLLLSSSLDTIAHSTWGPSLEPLQLLEQTPLGARFSENVLRPALLGEISTSAGPMVLFDTFALRRRWQAQLERLEHLAVYQDTVEVLERIEDTWRVRGRWGSVFKSERVILAVGTFLDGRCRTGQDTRLGGRPGETGAEHLRESLEALGVVFAPSFREASPTLLAASLDLERLSPLALTGGPVRAYEAIQANGRPIVLAPMTRAALELYLCGAGANGDIIGEAAWRTMDALKDAKIVTPGFEVEFLKVSKGPSGLGFAGTITGTNDYVSSIVSGLAAGTRRE